MKKKVISLALSLALTLTLLATLFVVPANAATLDTMVAGATQYSITDGTAMTAQYGTPTIDGEFEDVWTTTTWYKNDSSSLWYTSISMDVYLAYLWDENNYYGFLYVTGSDTLGDAGYISFDFDIGKQHDTSMPIGDAEYCSPYLWMHEFEMTRFLPNTDIKGWNWVYVGFADSIDFASSFVGKKLNDTTYVVEFCFPVHQLFTYPSEKVYTEVSGYYIDNYCRSYTNKEGDLLGVNIDIRDTTSGWDTRSQFAWSSTYTNAYASPQNWPTVTLVNDTSAAPAGEIVEVDGVKYYQVGGVGVMAGLVEVDGDLYFAGWNGKIVTNKLQNIWANATEDSSLTGQNRAFGADGKLLTGILNDVYYKDGVAATAGLVEVDGDYYFAGGAGAIVKNKLQYIWANATEDSALTGKNRAFGADGKLLTGILNDVYYEDGVAKMAGLVEVDGDCYFAGGAGVIVKDKVQYIWANSTDNADLTNTNQTFGADGRMVA